MNKIPIAKIGKSYGIKGWQKIHLLTDFPEQFKAGVTFDSDKTKLTIEKIDLKRGLVKFEGVNTPEDAKKLTNRMLYTTEEATKKNIKLKDNEYFWFDIIGCSLFENGELLGKVREIERANMTDYLVIDTDKKFTEKKYPKRFLIDFKRNVRNVDIENKTIEASGAKELLESLL
ncbi:ribosome maturation factor RimM [Nautilia sp.]